MIDVFISVSMVSNPGPCAVAALGVIDGQRRPRSMQIDQELTNFQALWRAVDLACKGLDGRAGVIWTRDQPLVIQVRNTIERLDCSADGDERSFRFGVANALRRSNVEVRVGLAEHADFFTAAKAHAVELRVAMVKREATQ